MLKTERVVEFGKHEIRAIARFGSTVTNRVPRQHQRAESLSGVAEPVLAALCPDAATDVTIFVRGVSRRVHDDGDQLGVVISLAVEQQQACLPRDRDANFIGQLESAGSFEVLLRHKYLG